MKQGKSLQELATELDRQNNEKKDYIAPAAKLRVGLDHPDLDPDRHGRLALLMEGKGLPVLGIGDQAHDQLAERLGIPRKYYDRMMEEAPELLCENANHWLRESTDNRMVRTLDGKARAFLSDRYRPMDNFDLMQAVLPVLTETKAEVVSCEVTEKRVYVKALIPGMREDVLAPGHQKGSGHNAYDEVQAGIVIANSEIGYGALSVAPAIHTIRCTNMAVFNSDAMKKYHVGRANEADEHWNVMSDKTKQLSDAALWAQVGDLTRAALGGQVFQRLVHDLRVARGQVIEGDPAQVIEVLAKTRGLSKDEESGVLRHLIEGGDLSRYGLHSAVTRMSQDVDSYDRASELERLGGQIIELPPTDWKVLVA